MSVEQAIAKVIDERGLKIKTVSERTGVKYSLLQPSLKGRRELRATELLAVCAFLHLDPKALLEQVGATEASAAC